ncbi:S-layer homology domain-containing protein [Rubeoparvulum massiliense]|uniref:S-layer homology domain-containing protein n=1 Tax=Rubeoparvulum massiliense TaxID=1631346 RepID=UPI00065DFC3B|nr:S-layer homology domain-containing protein [Rubeoparvulum massiliense]
MKLRKIMAWALVLALLVGITLPPMQASAAMLPDNMTLTFPDVNSSNYGWAMKHISKLALHGVVVGNDNGFYKPQDPVRQVEAVIMAIRVLNLEGEAKKAVVPVGDVRFTSLPDWAKGYVKVAYDHGLLKAEENRFNWNQPASRAWVAQLLVRTIGKDADAAALANQTNLFTDSFAIPVWAKGYVNYANAQGLITGYKEKNLTYFKPDKEITRAEMAVMLSRGSKFITINPYQRLVTGTVESVGTFQLSLRMANGDLRTFSLWNQAAIYDGEQKVELTQLQGQTVGLIVDQGVAYYVEKVDTLTPVTPVTPQPPVTGTTQSATVVQVYPAQSLLIVKGADGQTIETYTLHGQVKIVGLNQQPYTIQDLHKNDEIDLVINAQKEVTAITVKKMTDDRATTGIIFDLSLDDQLIIIQSDNGGYVSYPLSPTPTVIYSNVRYPSVKDLKDGDKVKVVVEKGFVTQIEMLAPNHQLTFTGSIVQLSTTDRVVTLKDQSGHYEAYPISDKVVVEIRGLDVADLTDLRDGDAVEAAIAQGVVQKIVVTNRTGTADVQGKIVSVDTVNKMITITDLEGKLRVFKVSDRVTLDIGTRYASLTDLTLGMSIQIQLEQDQIIYIKYDNSLQGTVEGISEERGWITVRTPEQGAKKYYTDGDPSVNIKGMTREDLGDIEVGDIVKVTLNDNEFVSRIDVERTFLYEITEVRESSNRVYYKDDRSNTDYDYINSDVKLIIPGITNPKVRDLAAGQIAHFTYMGDSLAKVEITQKIQGRIAKIDTVAKKLTINTLAGKQEVVNLENGFSISLNNKTYDSLSMLALNDPVFITKNVKGQVQIQVLQKVTGKYYTFDDKDYIYLVQEPSWLKYKLAKQVYIHRGDKVESLRNILKDQVITLYIYDDVVYEIEL